MSVLTIILTVIQLLSGLAVTVVVLMQSGKSAGLSGAISGGAETFLSKGKAKTENTMSVHWYSKSWMSKGLIFRSKLTKPLHRIFGVDAFKGFRK